VFKRLFWLMVGMSFGFGVAFWLMRFVRQTVQRYSPERVSSDLATAMSGLGRDLRLAAGDFRTGMREAEDDIRTKLESRQPLE
jgi:hypothetical protein